jgi:hypothetical protein
MGLRALAVMIGLVPWVWPAIHISNSLAESHRDFLGEVLPQFGVASRVVDYIKANATEGEPILIIGSEPEIYYFSERPACTRLVITYPLTGPYPYSPRLRREFLRDFEKHQPRYVIVCDDIGSLTEWGQDGARLLTDQVKPILNRSYRLEQSMDLGKTRLFLIFRRVESGQGATPARENH